jgi:hypothetical protein
MHLLLLCLISPILGFQRLCCPQLSPVHCLQRACMQGVLPIMHCKWQGIARYAPVGHPQHLSQVVPPGCQQHTFIKKGSLPVGCPTSLLSASTRPSASGLCSSHDSRDSEPLAAAAGVMVRTTEAPLGCVPTLQTITVRERQSLMLLLLCQQRRNGQALVHLCMVCSWCHQPWCALRSTAPGPGPLCAARLPGWKNTMVTIWHKCAAQTSSMPQVRIQ